MISNIIRNFNMKEDINVGPVGPYKYLINPNYKHYNFCKEITLWAVDVWTNVRELQEKMLTKEMDIIENIINFLPEFNFIEE